MVAIQVMHEILGLPHEQSTSATADHLGLEIKGQLNMCHNCAVLKAKQKGNKKVNHKKSKVQLEKLMLDISLVKSKSLGELNFGYWFKMNQPPRVGVSS